eukprot:1491415-Amphidinium_carterae.1
MVVFHCQSEPCVCMFAENAATARKLQQQRHLQKRGQTHPRPRGKAITLSMSYVGLFFLKFTSFRLRVQYQGAGIGDCSEHCPTP